MTEYTLTFTAPDSSTPVPPVTLLWTTPDEFARAVRDHAMPHLTDYLTAQGRLELADAFWYTLPSREGGCFLWLSLADETGARFCPARMTRRDAA